MISAPKNFQDTSTMDEIIIYEKSTCSKCRIALEVLDEYGTAYRRVRYYDMPLTNKKLAELIRKIGIAPRELLRKEDPIFPTLKIKLERLDDAEIISLMIEHPDLMQRPILERGEDAIVGRPSERILKFLKRS